MMTGKEEGEEANSKVHKEYETIFQQLLLCTYGPKTYFTAIVVAWRDAYCLLESIVKMTHDLQKFTEFQV